MRSQEKLDESLSAYRLIPVKADLNCILESYKVIEEMNSKSSFLVMELKCELL